MGRWLNMTPNGYEPVVGNRFTYKTSPAGAWDGTIQCEVLEVVPGERLAYSWKGGDEANVGYGSRLEPFSRVTEIITYLKKQFHDVPSVHMAYSAAILARAGHEVVWTRGDVVDGDVALVLSSIVDHNNETAFADAMASIRSRPLSG